ncbi:hypothetical protein ACFXP7_01865 [Microbacterium sp. P06]|uniref:hypothetical protein n=1 Tax=Microbacterium sp. P06 TaxID=3366949 RepID=UPI003744E3B7
MPSVPVSLPRLRGPAAALLCVILALLGVLGVTPAAQAADQGAGFGTWAPLSAHGWHGSMLIGGVHTYCIVPGLPLPTGGSEDRGVSNSAAGLSPQQLAGINALVTKYGQTSDPVQAAAVGWAVKATADRDATLHAWGYRGDSLAEAVKWTFSKIAPEHSDSVAALAETYHAEAAAVAVPSSDATLTLTTDTADARRGTVRFEASGRGVLTLTNAIFSDTGKNELADASPATDYAIIAAPPTEDGRKYSVRAEVHGTAEFAPAVHHFTTPGQQDTAGPAGNVEFAAEATDAVLRPVLFTPRVTTNVAEPEIDGGPFVDDVTLSAVEGVWPKTLGGGFVAITATAKIYRTDSVVPETEKIPADAEHVGDLALVSDAAKGPGVYRVTSDRDLPGPGVYTAVWHIDAKSQDAGTLPHLEPGYTWTENFGVATQMVTVVTPPPPPTPPQPEQPPAAQPPEEETRTLAATGGNAFTPRIAGAGGAVLLLGVALLAHLKQRRRVAASA